MLISHGLSEHIGWWQHVAKALAARGITCYVLDHYHHGRSAGLPGDAESYRSFTAGLATVLDASAGPSQNSALPLVVLAHSNGALIALHALQSLLEYRVRGLVLSSPFLGLPSRTARWAGLLARGLSWVNPAMRVPRPHQPRRLTGNRPLWPYYHSDPLRFGFITPRFFLAMEAALRTVWNPPDCGNLPLLLLRAGREAVVDPLAMESWFQAVSSPDKSLRDYPHLHHELFNETQWQEVLEDVCTWMESRFIIQQNPRRREDCTSRTG